MVSPPHGGRLVERLASEKSRVRLLEEAYSMPRVEVSESVAADAVNIAMGVYSPLEGFLTRNDYFSVLEEKRLSNDIPWTIPIVLDARRSDIAGVGEGDEIALTMGEEPFAIVEVEEVYEWSKKTHCRLVYGTTDPRHPGVARTLDKGELLLGGKVTLLRELEEPFERWRLWPKETRILFEEKGWRTIVGFQTRNVPHLGHEYVQKAALTLYDGLFVNPLVGWKKPGDYRDEVIVEAYRTLLRNYFPRTSVVFSVLRMEMRYAGPREAVHHAIVRKNFGCTHFIVGRDHAGVASFYGPYDAWRIFDEFPDLGIQPIFIKEMIFCERCGGVVSEKVCPHSEKHRVRISGTKLRALIKRKEPVPPYMMRPEVVEVVESFGDPFV